MQMFSFEHDEHPLVQASEWMRRRAFHIRCRLLQFIAGRMAVAINLDVDGALALREGQQMYCSDLRKVQLGDRTKPRIPQRAIAAAAARACHVDKE